MQVKVFPGLVKGALKAPPSKSCAQRACAAALLSNGKSIIDNVGNSNDERAAMDIIKRLGAEVSFKGDKLAVVSSDGIFRCTDPKKSVIVDTGESGLSMRMFAPIASLFNYDITFTGKGSLLKRPMDFLNTYLPQLGVSVESENGRLPITIRGPLKLKEITVSGGLSSQFLTGLLFAYAKAATKPIIIKVKDLTSKPYIDLTIDVLNKFGFNVINRDYERFEVLPELPATGVIKYTVEGDWSNAAFLLVAGVVAGPVSVKGLTLNSCQADKKIMDALYACGANIVISNGEITAGPAELKSFDFDATQCPDLFPPLVALAAYCKGTTTITGVTRLLHKESNRALALREEFKKMGVAVELTGDLMRISGGGQLTGAKVSSHNDHRIAMAATVAALRARGEVLISDSQAVNKSYPGFYQDMKKIGAKIIPA